MEKSQNPKSFSKRGRGLWKAWSNYGRSVEFWYFQAFKCTQKRTKTHMPTEIDENMFFSPWHLPFCYFEIKNNIAFLHTQKGTNWYYEKVLKVKVNWLMFTLIDWKDMTHASKRLIKKLLPGTDPNRRPSDEHWLASFAISSAGKLIVYCLL